MSTPPAIAIVGCAHIHTPGFVKRLQARSDVHVKWLHDDDAVRTAPHAEALKAKETTRLKDVLGDKAVQGIIVCSETTKHQQIVEAACAAGKHLFVEKPLGAGAADAAAMADAINAKGLIFTTGYFMRTMPVHLAIHALVQRGAFGQITRARGSNCHAGALRGWFDAKPDQPGLDWRWMADPAIAGVGAFGDLGTHSLDLLMWLLGDVERVSAATAMGTARYAGCDETGEGLLVFANGAIATLAGAWDDVANPCSLLISGTKGHAAVLDGKLFLSGCGYAEANGKQPWTELPAAHTHPLDAWVDAVLGKPSAPLVSPAEAAARSSVMEALYRANRTQSWVRPQRV